MIYFGEQNDLTPKDIKLLVQKIPLKTAKMKKLETNIYNSILEQSDQCFTSIKEIQGESLDNYVLNEIDVKTLLKSQQTIEWNQFDAISKAIFEEFIQRNTSKRSIIFCGGHDLKKEDTLYFQLMYLGQTLGKFYDFIFQGGGSGSMEAVHLGVIYKDLSLKQLIDLWNDLKSDTIDFPKIPKSSQVISVCCFSLDNSINNLQHNFFCFKDNALREICLMKASKEVILAPGGHGTFLESVSVLSQNGNQGLKGYIYDYPSFLQQTLKKSVSHLIQTTKKISYKTFICQHQISDAKCLHCRSEIHQQEMNQNSIINMILPKDFLEEEGTTEKHSGSDKMRIFMENQILEYQKQSSKEKNDIIQHIEKSSKEKSELIQQSSKEKNDIIQQIIQSSKEKSELIQQIVQQSSKERSELMQLFKPKDLTCTDIFFAIFNCLTCRKTLKLE